MHLPISNTAVLALNGSSYLDALQRGHRVHALPGVVAVIVEPERARVLVRFDPLLTTADTIRTSSKVDVDRPAGAEPWLALWPKLAHALPAAASLL